MELNGAELYSCLRKKKINNKNDALTLQKVGVGVRHRSRQVNEREGDVMKSSKWCTPKVTHAVVMKAGAWRAKNQYAQCATVC